MEESKRDKFKRLAESRTNACIKQIKLLENLSDASHYDYTKEDVTKILKAIRGALSKLEDSYFERKKKSDSFEL